MKTAQDRQKKSYADKRRTNLEFDVGDMVFIKVSPLRNIVRFGECGEISTKVRREIPHYKRNWTYHRVKLLKKLSGAHDMFHVSHVRKCLHDTAEIVEPRMLREVEVEQDATIRRAPTCILGSEVKKLYNREVKWLKSNGETIKETRLGRRKTRYVHCNLSFVF